ncbi:unnamed protein product [Medioppia subpectinata]|uniref:Uncharacterized protein n=1 Tax=Medioppia subpectinata TaxID=1979941 RepID=A0A7R9KK38_9ACAR|nr:unnamed protein product [Medioppia subpectinata]CAG2104884.1 unnamed protein product [Medioppia subpectinata]
MAPKRNSWIITDIVPKDSDTRVVHKPKDNTNGPKKKKKRNSKEAVVTTKDKLVTDWVKEGEVFDSQKSKNKHHMMSTNQSFKTNNFRDNCLKNRMEKGMILLSPNVEKKIYTMKKALRKKDKELEEEITLSTLEGNHSIDADAVDIKPTIVKTEVTKKVVKF